MGKHLIFKFDVLDSGRIVKFKDLRKFDCLEFGSELSEVLTNIKSSPRNKSPTGSWATKDEVKAGPTGSLLGQLKLLKVDRKVSEYTEAPYTAECPC